MPVAPAEHDAQLWLPVDTRARVEKPAVPDSVVIDNQTDLPDEAVVEYFTENTAMFGFGQETRYLSYPSEGTMMARSKWRPPRNVIEEISIARDFAERDDDVAGALGAILACSYGGGYQNQHEDEQVEHTFAEMSEDIGLAHVLHEMHRELLISSQINTVCLFTRQTYDIRPENVTRLIRRSVAAPMIGVLPAERIRILGDDMFGGGQLAYVPEGMLAEWLRGFFNASTSAAKKREMRLADPIAAALFIGRAEVPWQELGDGLLSSGMNLYLLNPEMVKRSTFAKGAWRYPRPLLTRNLALLEAKRLLNVMDHALLQGGINYIVVAKKGDEKKPATQPELTNLYGIVQRASRSGVLIGDHRINIEIVQPDLSAMLDPDKRRMIGRKLSQALLRVPEFGSDETGMAVQTFTNVAQAVMTDDRNIVVGHLHRYIWRECMKRNTAVFGRSDRPLIWTPMIILQGLDFWTQYLLKLYDRGDLPRKYMVAFGGYDYDAVKAQKQREVTSGHDEIFTPPPVPYTAPGQMGQTPNPYQYGNPANLPPGSAGPQDNPAGRPQGARNIPPGQAPDRARPTRVIRKTPGETVRAVYSEPQRAVLRIGTLTERVLGEYPQATLGRVTPAERAALDARQTTNAANVIVVPVNPGYQIQDVQAVRLEDHVSMLCGNRSPDGAVVAAAFCFREPRFSIHEAEDMVIRWGFEISPVQADDVPSDADTLTCPSCGETSDADAAACDNCGFDGPPFSLPAGQRSQPPQPIAITVNIDGKSATVQGAAPPPTIGEPPPEALPEPPPPPLIPVKQDDAFLHMMIEHHKQGLKLAQIQVANGKRPEVRKLAESLIISHNAEIERLKKLKGT